MARKESDGRNLFVFVCRVTLHCDPEARQESYGPLVLRYSSSCQTAPGTPRLIPPTKHSRSTRADDMGAYQGHPSNQIVIDVPFDTNTVTILTPAPNEPRIGSPAVGDRALEAHPSI